MKAVRISTLLSVCGLLAGCGGVGDLTGRTASVQSGGLKVSVSVPKRFLHPGEKVDVVVTATNTTAAAMRISANSTAPAYVRLWRLATLDWERIMRFPKTPTMIMRPWTLSAWGRRTFPMTLTVSPDWPTNQPLRITGELNGRPDAVPDLLVRVVAAPGAAPQ